MPPNEPLANGVANGYGHYRIEADLEKKMEATKFTAGIADSWKPANIL